MGMARRSSGSRLVVVASERVPGAQCGLVAHEHTDFATIVGAAVESVEADAVHYWQGHTVEQEARWLSGLEW